jgi:hypothetical protein
VLRIAKQGSMEAGGSAINCATNDGGYPNSTRFPSGHVVVDNVYATFQYPADQRYPYPILFNSGGGHTARVYDTTPDGREGWLTLFVRQGFPVYGVDRTNTGRSGTDICKINAVKLGKAPAAELPAINRYAAESSWVTSRSHSRMLITTDDQHLSRSRRDAEIRRRFRRAHRQDCRARHHSELVVLRSARLSHGH